VSEAEPSKKKKKQSIQAAQRELRELSKPSPDALDKSPVDQNKIFIRVGAVLAVIWVTALVLA
jgi:CHASE3 domain sensor protein